MALAVAVTLRRPLPDPGAEIVAGVNTAEAPVGRPVAERTTAALKPPLTATLKLTLLFAPALTEREFADNAG
jgi:hypothetical protein